MLYSLLWVLGSGGLVGFYDLLVAEGGLELFGDDDFARLGFFDCAAYLVLDLAEAGIHGGHGILIKYFN